MNDRECKIYIAPVTKDKQKKRSRKVKHPTRK
jgi:hypothetical protein